MNIRTLSVPQQRHHSPTRHSVSKRFNPNPRQLLIAFGAVLILGLCSASVVSVWMSRHHALVDSERSLSTLSTVLSQRISEPLQRADTFLIEAAQLAAFEMESRASRTGVRIHKLLNKEVSVSPYLRAAFILDGAGATVYSSRSYPAKRADHSISSQR